MAASSTSFKPGNPGGGRRAMPQEVRAALDAAAPEAIAFLARVLNDSQARTVDRIRAAEALLDRGLGKPGQQIEIDNAEPIAIYIGRDFDKL